MRNINKGVEPNSLTRHRAQNNADYDNYPDKQDLRDYLIREQAWLCAYCMGRIRPEIASMKIEHWRCQLNYPDEQLSYQNLLGVCLGNQGSARNDQHCDTRKADAGFSLNPATRNVERIISYSGDGRITASDAVFSHELDAILNLNQPRLVGNRKAVLDSFIKALPRSGSLSAGALHRLITVWTEPVDGKLHPFCMVVVCWLYKRLKRLT